MTTSLFAQYVVRDEAAINLAEAALLIAHAAYPNVDVAYYLRWLDAQGLVARERLATASSFGARVNRFTTFVTEELGFRGNETQYDDPRNSYLNDVIERRTGIPITLSLIFMELGARAGLAVEGVGLPGHFIVRVSTADEYELRDPFHGGAALTLTDCEALMRRVYGRPMALLPHYLDPVGKKAFLTRMLNNLENTYIQTEQWPLALMTIQHKLVLQQDARQIADEMRALGLVYFKLDRMGDAEAAWLRYLSLNKDAHDAHVIRQNIEMMRAAVARRN